MEIIKAEKNNMRSNQKEYLTFCGVKLLKELISIRIFLVAYFLLNEVPICVTFSFTDIVWDSHDWLITLRIHLVHFSKSLIPLATSGH